MTFDEEIAARQKEMDARIERHGRTVTFTMVRTQVNAGPRKLTSHWGIELEQDLEHYETF